MSDVGAIQSLDRAITELLAAQAVWVSSPRARELVRTALGDACAAKEALQRAAGPEVAP